MSSWSLNCSASNSFVVQAAKFHSFQCFKDKILKLCYLETLKPCTFTFEPAQPFLMPTCVGPLSESGLSQTAEGETHALEGFSETKTPRSRHLHSHRQVRHLLGAAV